MLYLSNQEKIQVQTTPLGTGGEGTVFAIEKPTQYHGYVAKIYHETERKPQREAKIKYLIENPLTFYDKLSFIFPEEIIYQDGEFVGYLMPKARGEYDLTVLSSLTLSNKLTDDWVAQYRRDKPENLRNYQKIAHHLALAFAEFYQQEEYIFTDLKPENIKVNLQGKISVIDLDSLQIQGNGKVFFPAEKISQEYSPPERAIFKEGEILSPAWTYFSMSVILYKLLLGLHPFSVTGKGDLKRLATLADKMKYGLFPFGRHSDKIEVIPAPHQNFKSLPQEWQNLFIKSLDTFLTQPEYRPSAAEWAEALQIKTLALKEYKNPLSKIKTEELTQANDFVFDKPIRRGFFEGGRFLGISLAALLLNILQLTEIDFAKGLAFGIIIPLVTSDIFYYCFQNTNLKIDVVEQQLIVKDKNIFFTQTKKYELRELRFVLKEVWFGRSSTNFEIVGKNRWGLPFKILNLWISKKNKRKEKIKLILRILIKLNIQIECEGIVLNKFLYDV